MRKAGIAYLFITALCNLTCWSQDQTVINTYINTYKEIAISEMLRTGVPASITLAQGIHETAAGTSSLVLKSNNHFGIKCKSYWTGESVRHDDDARGECFRKYDSPVDSYKDHSDFLKSGERYSFLFSLDPTDYSAWAYGLKKAGYATNPAYPQLLIKLIEDYRLQDYTFIALGKRQQQESPLINPTVYKAEKETEIPLGKKETVYPEGEFAINETKVIFAKKGTSFLALALQYNIPLARVFDFNDLGQTEVLEKDQLIYLQRKRKMGENEFHIVQPGESLHDIAQTEAIRLESLLELNGLRNTEMPAPGEQLSLQKKSTLVPRLQVKENYSLRQ